MLIKILLFLLLCSPVFGAEETLVPTAGSGWDTGDYTDIDEGQSSTDCTDCTSTNKAGESMTGGTFSDLVTADADDTYNTVTVFFRSDMTGTANDEIVALTVTDGTTVTEIDGNNGTPADDNSGDISGYHNFTSLNALTYGIVAEKTGAESVTLWRAENLWIVVDYTAVAGPSQVFYTTKKEKNVQDYFDGMPDIITIQ